ncbi:MAG TPA: ATP-binding cassette domain-containing protein [Bacteroidales bacterium]|nr:ATP-binding cassette domain-containing protein [Bacteroidales bacterium]HRZ77661.1 ATP-binding cassette domain-containing protein [Bacteroidales bacterium]
MALDTIIELSNVSIYQKNILILTNVSFTINRGEFVYLIGRTGSGKSSLLKTLYADLPLVEGQARIADIGLNHLKKKDIPFLRRKLGIVFQDFQLLPDRTVNDNLLFVLRATGWTERPKMQQRIQDVLEKVGLGTKGFKMPNELSGGEQQRVAIARALLNDPDVILADEPTGNLDPDTSIGIMNLMFEISKAGRAVLMATHDYNIIRRFPSRILRCDHGNVLS